LIFPLGKKKKKKKRAGDFAEGEEGKDEDKENGKTKPIVLCSVVARVFGVCRTVQCANEVTEIDTW
jgi:hypothetical protein